MSSDRINYLLYANEVTVLDFGKVGIAEGNWSCHSSTTELYRIVALDECRSDRIREHSSSRGEDEDHSTDHSGLVSGTRFFGTILLVI